MRHGLAHHFVDAPCVGVGPHMHSCKSNTRDTVLYRLGSFFLALRDNHIVMLRAHRSKARRDVQLGFLIVSGQVLGLIGRWNRPEHPVPTGQQCSMLVSVRNGVTRRSICLLRVGRSLHTNGQAHPVQRDNAHSRNGGIAKARAVQIGKMNRIHEHDVPFDSSPVSGLSCWARYSHNLEGSAKCM